MRLSAMSIYLAPICDALTWIVVDFGSWADEMDDIPLPCKRAHLHDSTVIDFNLDDRY